MFSVEYKIINEIKTKQVDYKMEIQRKLNIFNAPVNVIYFST